MWLRWVLVTTAAGILTSIISAVAAVSSLGLGMLVAGIVFGYCAGSAQSTVLRSHVSHVDPSRWLMSSLIGGTLGWITTIAIGVTAVIIDGRYGFNEFPFVLAGVLIGGALLGAIQWRISQGKRGVILWMLANAVGLGVGLVSGVIFATATLPYVGGRLYSPYDALMSFASGSIAICILAITTGTTLIWLLRNRQR